MGEFYRFARRYWFGSIFVVVGAAFAFYGPVSDAYDLYRAGLPGWGWQCIGLALFFAAVAHMLFRIDQSRLSPVAAQPAVPKESAEDRALTSIFEVLQRAKHAMAQQGYAKWPAVIPAMSAALLTANKVFGIPLPPPRPNDMDVLALADGRRILEQVYPLLLEGHLEEARARGAEIVEQMRKMAEADGQSPN